MIKVKKLAAFLLALVLILSLAGCGNPQKRFIVYGRFQDNYTTDMFDVFCDWETINPLLEKCNFEEYGLYPKFFDPQTGEVHYPGTNGDINTDGFTNGVYHVETLTSGTIIDRYGSNGSGRYFSPDGTPYAERALPPFMERQPYNRYRVVQPFDVKAGEIAPWFNQPGKGIQFLSDYSLKYLLKHGYIEILK